MKTFKEQLGYPLLAFLLCLFGTSVEGAQLPPPPATQAEVNAGTGTYKYVTPATLAGWTGTPTNRYATNVLFDASGFNGNLTTTDTNAQQIAQKLDDLVLGGAGVTGMNTNTFTRFVDGQWQLFTNIPDGSLCFSNLTYPQFVLMLRTNGSLLITNSVTGNSNSVDSLGLRTKSVFISSDGSLGYNLGIVGNTGNPALSVYNLASSARWGVVDFQNSHSARLIYGGYGLVLTGPRDTPVDEFPAFRAITNAYTTAPDATLGGELMFKQSTKTWRFANGDDTGVQSLAVSNLQAMTVTGTNGVIVSSNSWVNQPTLAEGQAAFLSSNGVPHVVWKVGGVLTTNNLTATGAADGVGISSNGGSGLNIVLTNATLQDANGIDTFRPNREVVNSSGNVVADFDARNLNGTGGNALNWSADGTLVRVFNDLQVDGKITTPAAIVSNTPAADQLMVFSSATTAKATSDITVSSLTATTAGGNGRAFTNLNGGSLFWNTNGVADITLIDLTKPYAHTNHTAAFTIAGFTTDSYPAGGTNYPIVSRWYTNNSVGAKPITLPASWLDLGIKGNPVYNTNYGVLSLWIIPGSATNYLWVGR